MTSRERILAAISHQDVDYVPCSFMIFTGLLYNTADDVEFITRELDLGLDPVVEMANWRTDTTHEHPDLPGPPLRFHPEMQITDWVEDKPSIPVIHRRYDTPAGPLTAAVRWTEDWKAGARVPLFDDWGIPRAEKFLVETDEDLDRLPYVLTPLKPGSCRGELQEKTASRMAIARERGLATAGGLGVGLEAAAWLAGYEALALASYDRPEWLDRLVEILHVWNVSRMEAMLELGVDIFFRRGWYEGMDFLSPAQVRRYVLPSLQREARLAHDAGARFAYINTSGTMPILEMLIEAGVDVLVGVDPIQGKGTDMAAMRQQTAGRMALWGGVNGFITVERGSPDEVRAAVDLAMRTLGPNGFILSPVDNVSVLDAQAWSNVQALVAKWQELRTVSSVR